MDEMVIPESHWRKDTVSNWRNYVSYWEGSLRASIAAVPDPSERFGKWLADKSGAEPRNLAGLGVRLVFLEQPYLEWAEAVERIIENTEQELRKLIAYEVTNPDREC